MSQAQFLANSTATRRRHKEHEENSLTAERAPNIAELRTILLSQYPCRTNPCIDPIFGPTQAFYWSSTTLANFPGFGGASSSPMAARPPAVRSTASPREGCVVAGARYLNYSMIRMSG